MAETYDLFGGDHVLSVDHTRTRHRYTVKHRLPNSQYTKPEIVEGATAYLQVVPKNLVPWGASVASQYWVDLLLGGTKLRLNKQQVMEHHGLAKTEFTRLGNKGKNKGTDYHGLMELYFNDRKAFDKAFKLATEEVQELVIRTTDWWQKSGWTFVSCEQGVYSPTLNYAGKIDLEAITSTGKHVICDFKSTKLSRTAPDGVYLEYFFQLGGYALPKQEEGVVVDDTVILNPNHIDTDGDLLPVFSSDFGMSVEDAVLAFSLCKNLTDTIEYWESKRRKT